MKNWASNEVLYADRLYSRAETETLSRERGITHLLVQRGKLGPFEVESLFENSRYRVYQISPEK